MSTAYQVVVSRSFNYFLVVTSWLGSGFLFFVLFFHVEYKTLRCFTKTSHKSRKTKFHRTSSQGTDLETLRFSYRFIGNGSWEHLGKVIEAMLSRRSWAMTQLQQWSQTVLQKAFLLGWPFRIFMSWGKGPGFYIPVSAVLRCRPHLVETWGSTWWRLEGVTLSQSAFWLRPVSEEKLMWELSTLPTMEEKSP